MKKCTGCGIVMQYQDKNKLGYTRKKENTLCERCFKLKNYGDYKEVPLTNKEYQQTISSIKKDELIVYVTDILLLDPLPIKKFKNIIIVITKKDIMPKSIKPEKIINYCKKIYPEALDIIITSSKTNEGITELYESIIKLSKTKKAYIIGMTNSGKSSLINRIISLKEEENEKKIVTSIYPSTTLDKIEIKLKNLTLIDTPGLLNENNIVNSLPKNQIKKITPTKEIKPKTCQIEGKGSIIIDEYLRIDYKTLKKNSMTIYASNSLNKYFASDKNHKFYENNKFDIFIKSKQDIVLPGIGFIKCREEMQVTIYTPTKIKPYTRNNLI